VNALVTFGGILQTYFGEHILAAQVMIDHEPNCVTKVFMGPTVVFWTHISSVYPALQQLDQLERGNTPELARNFAPSSKNGPRPTIPTCFDTNKDGYNTKSRAGRKPF
jgi:hypothetical protein